ncbi:SMC-Scp complex subunit ScpB [Guyparkeria hydrothermalis]|uniref:SMC-Scp complex subunit ScpB n=1 Tax=Guyparkeria TaxID=2035712 RepID=UPI0010AD4247|nr:MULTISPECIES: SMC-Scp complex subunit ScpB [Guyparkeria]MCL7751498.1 SMC-Scp complex subunit ScpB [Guyparkeria hydrothermalis]TKA88707.1 SMC-Scp complex subunit ScpB [Guyparkeria sp. SB14A]
MTDKAPPAMPPDQRASSGSEPPEGLVELVEALLLTIDEPLSLDSLGAMVGQETAPELLEATLARVAARWESHRFIELASREVGGRRVWHLVATAAVAPYLKAGEPGRVPKLSRAALETLALIVWRQPITRGEIEAARGVAVNPQILKQLAERGWVRSLGVKDSPGRPEMLGTTREFLADFGLDSLADLPDFERFAGQDDIDV